MQAPRKPWEKAADGSARDSEGQGEGTSPALPQDCLDPEFPPVEDETPEESQTQDAVSVPT